MVTYDKGAMKDALLAKLRGSHRLIWETPDLARPFMKFPGHVPVTEDVGYRRTLYALQELEDESLIDSYTTIMNGRVWWARSRVY